MTETEKIIKLIKIESKAWELMFKSIDNPDNDNIVKILHEYTKGLLEKIMLIKKSMREPTKKCQWDDPVFQEIYENANGKSMLTGIPIFNPIPFNFSHTLEKGKGKYYKFMYYIKNIWVLTEREHTLWHGSEGQRQKYADECKRQGIPCNWQALYDLRDELKQEYKERFG